MLAPDLQSGQPSSAAFKARLRTRPINLEIRMKTSTQPSLLPAITFLATLMSLAVLCVYGVSLG